MIFSKRRFACAVSVMVIAAPVLTAAAHGLEIESAWTAGPAAPAASQAAYLTIVNEGFHAEHLYGGSTPLAERVELHQSTDPDAMRKVDRIEIPLSDSLDMRRAGYHIMLIGLKGRLNPGDRIPISLSFGEGRVETSYITVSGGKNRP